MSLLRTLSIAFVLLATHHFSFAQGISRQYQNDCTLEQVKEHQNVNGKKPTQEDFMAYCACQAEFVSKNASSQQFNSLEMNPKDKPEWLKSLENKAFKSCINIDPKMST
jgi:hypothetical protein